MRPTLFQEIAAVARRLGVKPPDQIRLAYLPCCGVVGWRRTRILLLGLPLLQVLTHAELRAVLAHELAHLARGDVALSAGAARFVHGLGRAIDRREGLLRGPLGTWARLSWRVAHWLEAPIARGQEARADRNAASVAGGDAAASALVKVAMVQPLFREVLDRHDPDCEDLPNLYALFRAFWRRLPNEVREAMRPQPPRRRHSPPTPPPGPPRSPGRLPVLPLAARTPQRPLSRLDPHRRPRSLRATPPQPPLRQPPPRAERLPPRPRWMQIAYVHQGLGRSWGQRRGWPGVIVGSPPRP